MGKVGKIGHRKVDRDADKGDRGKTLLRHFLEFSLCAGALLILLLTMFGTTESTLQERRGFVSPREGWNQAKIARLTPGYAVVSDPLAARENRARPADGVSELTSSEPRQVWPLAGKSDDQAGRISQIVLDNAPAAAEGQKTPAPLPHITNVLWILAAGVLVLLGIHRKLAP